MIRATYFGVFGAQTIVPNKVVMIPARSLFEQRSVLHREIQISRGPSNDIPCGTSMPPHDADRHPPLRPGTPIPAIDLRIPGAPMQLI